MPDIEQLLNDPEFLSLPEEEQNAFIDEMKQKDLGVIPKAENILSKALRHTAPSMTSGIGMANPLAPMMTARSAKEGIVDKNVKNPIMAGLVNFATDPLTYGGGAPVARKVGKVASEAGGVAKQIPNVLTRGRRVKTVGKFKSALDNQRWSTMTDEFGGKLDEFMSANPDKTIDLRPAIEEAAQRAQFNPEVNRLITNDPILRILVNQPNRAAKLTLREAQQIKANMLSKMPEGVKSGAKRSPSWREAKMFEQGIGRAISEAFPDMAPVYEKYAKGAEQYKKFSPAFRSKQAVEQTIGSNSFNPFSFLHPSPSNMGGEVSQEALKEFAPNVAREISQTRKANVLVGAGKKALTGVAGVALQPWKLFKNQRKTR